MQGQPLSVATNVHQRNLEVDEGLISNSNKSMIAPISVVQIPVSINPNYKQLDVRAPIEKNIIMPKNSLMLGLREDDEEFERYLKTNYEVHDTKQLESSSMPNYN